MRITKLFLLGMVTAGFAASCSSDDSFVSPETNDSSAIEFGTYVAHSVESRAGTKGDMDLEHLKKGFGVFAYHKVGAGYSTGLKPNFMYNQQVTYQTSKWVYAPVKYWPNNPSEKVSFFAYAPYVETVSSDNVEGITKIAPANNGTGDPIISYKVSDDATKVVDLVYDNTQKDKEKPAVGDKIKFQFKHALCKLQFNVQGVFDKVEAPSTDDVDTNTKIYMQEVKLVNGFGKSGDLNLATGAWSNIEPAAGAREIAFGVSNFVEALTEASNGAGVTKEKVALLKTATPFFTVIPTTLDGSKKVQMVVKYKVVTTDAALEGGKYENVNTITCDLSSLTGLEAGKAYTFNIKLGMTTVKVDADVTAWGTNTEIDVDAPKNK